MKKSTVLLTIAISLFLSSCYSVKIAAPIDRNIRLATPDEPLLIQQKVTNWYALFGAIPISKKNPDYFIRTLDLEKVRVTTKITVGNVLLDILLNGMLFFIPTTVVTTTTLIEGNPRKANTEVQE
jgi:hypothetical protein